MHVRNIGGSAYGVSRALKSLVRDPCAGKVSVTLMIGDRLVAFILVRVRKALAIVDARVVAPDYQGTWANVLLMATASERATAIGAQQVRFDCNDSNSDTLKLAKRSAAQVVGRADWHTLDLAEDAAAQSEAGEDEQS
jgi:hypothetical protein